MQKKGRKINNERRIIMEKDCASCLYGKVYLDSGGMAVIYCRLYRNSYPISHCCNRFKKIKDAD